jgi:hypothetical protein
MAFSASQVTVYPTYDGTSQQDNLAIISLTFDFIQHSQLIPIHIAESWVTQTPGTPLAIVDGRSPQQQFVTGVVGTRPIDLPTPLTVSNATFGIFNFPRDTGAPIILTRLFEDYLYSFALDSNDDNVIIGPSMLYYRSFIMLHS